MELEKLFRLLMTLSFKIYFIMDENIFVTRGITKVLP